VSEENGDYRMMFPPRYEGRRHISLGIYGTFKFSKGAEQALKRITHFRVSQELVEALAQPEKCLAFRSHLMSNPAYSVGKIDDFTFEVSLPETQVIKSKKKSKKPLTKVVDRREIQGKIDGEDLESIAREEELVMAGNIYSSASQSLYETKLD